jgi:hypothetical protein
MAKSTIQIRFENGTDEKRCEELLLVHASQLMAAADVNSTRSGGQHKAYLPLPEEGLILMCAGRQQAEKEGVNMGKPGIGPDYLMIAYRMEGPIGQYIRHHMETDPNAIIVPLK